MKTKENKDLNALNSQKINADAVLGGTKQEWTNEYSKPLVDNSIPEGRVKKLFKKGRLSGVNPKGPTLD